MSNIIDSIQLSGVTYTIQGSGGGGNPTVELTQAEYDALVESGAVQTNTYYIITDAQAGDLTQYWTSAQTQSAITSATSGKVNTSSVVSSVTSASTDSEIPTAKAVYDAIPTGGTGGGKAVVGGRGITVTSGETADTVSFSLPISAGTGTNSLVVGTSSVTASGNDSFAGGDDAIASGNWAFAFGRGKATNNYTFAANGGSKATRGYSAAFNTSEANNSYAFSCGTSKSNGYASFSSGWDNKSLSDYESSFGYYNVSNKANTTFGDSGNTLFSVGNGTADNARHNAFEIRQNGDIYLNNGTSDIKLQDYIQIKVVKLTQSAYDALSPNYDSNTLYVIVN